MDGLGGPQGIHSEAATLLCLVESQECASTYCKFVQARNGAKSGLVVQGDELGDTQQVWWRFMISV